MEVLGILTHVAMFRGLSKREVVRLGMYTVYGKLRMVPVNERMIEADLKPLGAEGFNKGLQEVALGRVFVAL